MKYYRVKKDSDNVRRISMNKYLRPCIDGIYVQNELYTPKEIEKFIGWKKHVIPVEVSKKQTYFFFGSRFSYDCGYSD